MYVVVANTVEVVDSSVPELIWDEISEPGDSEDTEDLWLVVWVPDPKLLLPDGRLLVPLLVYEEGSAVIETEGP